MDLFSDLPEPSDSQQNDDRLSSNSLKTSDKSEETKDDTKFNDEEHLRCGVEKRKLEDVEENISNNGLSRIKPSVKYKLKSYFAERKGERDEMQDAHITFDNYTDEINDLDHSVHRVAVYGVYDGHGGARASR